MTVKDEVLELLMSTEGYISGEEMAERLKVSRNSVWKAVNSLRRLGYDIEAVTNKGYAMVSESDVLSAVSIREKLKGPAKTAAIDVREEVSSTNYVIKDLAEKNGAEGMVLVARSQTQGRGRLGRSFYSPKDTGLYMSILLRPTLSPEDSLCITTAAAVAVAMAIDELTGERAEIKWVNDVYFHGKKVCGILTEASIDFETKRLSYAVLGIGINLKAPPQGFPPEIKDIAGAVFGAEPAKGAAARLTAGILNHFFGFYSELETRSYMAEYRSRSMLTGMHVSFVRGNEHSSGTVTGIDEKARLLITLDSGEKAAFSAGEVQIDKSFLKQLSERGERK